jgi:hypothetical protein
MILSTRFRGLAFHSSSFWKLGKKCLNEVEILGLFLGRQEVYLRTCEAHIRMGMPKL